VFAYQSGEQYITKACLVADPGMEVEIYPGTESMYKTWVEEAKARHQNVLALFGTKYGRRFASEQEVKQFLKPMLERKAAEMANFVQSGVPSNPYKRNRVRVMADLDVLGTVRGSTRAAIAPFAEDPVAARRSLHAAVSASVPEARMRSQLREFYLEQGFRSDDTYALLWTRTSGRTSAAAPHLDTNPTMLAQMMVSIRRRDPHRKLVVIGDPVEIPGRIGNEIVPHRDLDLTQYWNRDSWPAEKSDMAAQTFFLALVQSHHPKTISVGTNSGILELPHLLGMRTLYLENKADHPRKGMRWEKKHVLGDIDRLTTSSTTFQWGQKEVLFDEIRTWIAKTSASRERDPTSSPDKHNQLMGLVVKLAALSHQEEKQEDESRPFSKQLGILQEEFARAVGGRVRAKEGLRSEALAAMTRSSERDGFTTQERAEFDAIWSKYWKGDTRDRREGNLEWLRRTGEKWQEVLAEQQQEPATLAPPETASTELPAATRPRANSLPPAEPARAQAALRSKEI
jgi:hypothetical protein